MVGGKEQKMDIISYKQFIHVMRTSLLGLIVLCLMLISLHYYQIAGADERVSQIITAQSGWGNEPDPNTILPQKDFRQWHSGSFFLELNDDGLLDIYADWKNYQAFKNNGDGTFSSISWNKPFSERLSYTEFGDSPEAGLMDINGDGFTDAIAEYRAYLSNGIDGWVRAPEWDIVPGEPGGYGCRGGGCRVGDINGDGLIDFVYSRLIPGFNTRPDILEQKISLNTGNGWEIREDVQIPVYFRHDKTDNLLQLLDVNGDKLSDIVDLYGDGKVYLNNGKNGWQAIPSPEWFIPPEIRAIDFYPTLVTHDLSSTKQSILRFTDINDDGLPDIVKSYKEISVMSLTPDRIQYNKVYLNNGINGWNLAPEWTLPGWSVIAVIDDMSTIFNLEVIFVDLNGDDLIDVAQSYYGVDPDEGYPYIYRWHQEVYLAQNNIL